jgi:hypothetical protein
MKKTLVIHLIGLAVLAVMVAVGCSEDPIQKPVVATKIPEPGAAMLGGGENLGDVAMAEDNAFGALVGIVGPIGSYSYDLLQGNGHLGFGDVQAGPQPGTHYESALVSGCAGIAERFLGQDRATVLVDGYPHDALSAAAAGPLALQSGEAGENIGVAAGTSCGASEVLIGWGPLGYPDDWGGGEGSLAILFDDDQSEFGLRMCGGNGGQVVLQFFDRSGGLIATATVNGVREEELGFRRTGGENDIAGVSIHNSDIGGIAVDDILFDVSICDDCVEGGGTRVTPETFNVVRYSRWVTGHATVPAGYMPSEITGATIVSIGPLAASIPGEKHGDAVFKFSSDAFAEVADQLVGPEEPRMEDVPVCIEYTMSDGKTLCASCWMIDITHEGKPGGPDSETRGAGPVSADHDASNQ